MKKLLIATTMLMLNFAFAAEPTQNITLADGRTILADAKGMSLYTFDVDRPGVSNCHGECLRVWPAAIVSAETIVNPPFGTIIRDNGAIQLTLEDKPLYTFFGDKKTGDIRGDKLQNVWHIIPVSL